MSEENKFIIQSLIAAIICWAIVIVLYLHGGIKMTPPILCVGGFIFTLGGVVLLINKLFKK